MNRYKDLRAILIRKFIFTVITIGISEYGVTKLLNHTLIPVIFSNFFQINDFNEDKLEGLVITLFALSASIILQLIKVVLPVPLSYSIECVINVINKNFLSPLVREGSESVLSNMSYGKQSLLLLVLVFILSIFLIPFVLGALYYSIFVINYMQVFEREDRAKYREFERKRNLMISDIAHDLKTPMTTVSGYAMALSDGMVSDDKKQEYLDAINAKSKRMNDLINLLFDYVKLDSEGFTLEKSKVDICELLRECVAFQYQDIEDAGFELDLDIPEESIIIEADKLQFSRVITNLITNAIRHNDEGTKLGVYLKNEYDVLRIIVADSGNLIEQEKAEYIFDPFVVGDESRNSRGGTGLGLSIAKKVVDMHGFSIRLVQKPDIIKYQLPEDFSKMFMITLRNSLMH
ncbi:MAG: HAMP domain-containing histidine kinase [Eubacterium sp.]|nr:HAMP domain-containing histidine kinase [Eubacterium sp.]